MIKFEVMFAHAGSIVLKALGVQRRLLHCSRRSAKLAHNVRSEGGRGALAEQGESRRRCVDDTTATILRKSAIAGNAAYVHRPILIPE